ncbi:2-oxo-4-hydroxy-4-carboxy-5-ureidoimidazoline decarboxylase [Streptomyces griseoviridis]
MTPTHLPGRVAIPALPEQTRAPLSATALPAFNSAPEADLRRRLLDCLHSARWTERVAAHRPYPDLDALLAAADEAAYDLTPAELSLALTAETLPALPPDTYEAAYMALDAARAAHEARFGHAFVICLDAINPNERLDHVLTAIRSRLANDPEEERAVAAEELRGLARQRLRQLLEGANPSVRATPGA